MYKGNSPLSGREIIDIYFLENRARLLEIASFLDRVDRAADADEAKEDFRYKALLKAAEVLLGPGPKRTKAVQLGFSDPTTEPIGSAAGLIAYGAWKGADDEDH